jgi:NAD(P)-dependent dehydrogenase (short-subunit alcohol dehydrogenase family)
MFSQALIGKRILVTGGGTGLGREMALGLASQGASVCLCGRRPDVLRAAADDIAAKTGSRVDVVVANVRDAASVEAAIEAAWQAGPLTGVVNNAGANFIAPTETISPRGYEAIRATIMDGSFYVTQACGKRWIAAGLPGSVVSNLVTWVWTGSAYVVPAAMAKAAVHAMTMSLAVEWGPHRIRVNAIAPGPFPTENAWAKLNPLGDVKGGATEADQIPLRRYGRMDELRNLLIFLMSDGCDYITGQTIGIDGGHHLAAPSTFAGLAAMSADDWKRAREVSGASVTKEKAGRQA